MKGEALSKCQKRHTFCSDYVFVEQVVRMCVFFEVNSSDTLLILILFIPAPLHHIFIFVSERQDGPPPGLNGLLESKENNTSQVEKGEAEKG